MFHVDVRLECQAAGEACHEQAADDFAVRGFEVDRRLQTLCDTPPDVPNNDHLAVVASFAANPSRDVHHRSLFLSEPWYDLQAADSHIGATSGMVRIPALTADMPLAS